MDAWAVHDECVLQKGATMRSIIYLAASSSCVFQESGGRVDKGDWSLDGEVEVCWSRGLH